MSADQPRRLSRGGVFDGNQRPSVWPGRRCPPTGPGPDPIWLGPAAATMLLPA